MISHLTDAQRSKFRDYADRWIQIGLCTDPADRPRAEAAIRLVYQRGERPPPERIIWCGSPLDTVLTALSVGASVEARVGARVRADVLESVEASVAASVWADVVSVWEGVRASVTVEADIVASVWEGVRPSVEASVARVWEGIRARASVDWEGVGVRASVEASVARVWEGIRASVRPNLYGQHDAKWLAFYRFFRDECGLTHQTEKLDGLWELCQSAGWTLPFRTTCLVSERHTTLRRDATGQLHCEDGPAIAYPDGWEIYALHGVRVPQALVRTPSTLLDPTVWVVHQSNAEIRREAIRKIGIERALAQLQGRILESGLDQAGQPCELLLLELGDGRRRPYIKLRHPGMGTYHVEGVPPECDTLEKAFRFRNGISSAPTWLR